MPVQKRQIQKSAPRPRGAAVARARVAKGGTTPPSAYVRLPEVEAWIRKEVQAQERIYRGIVREMNALNDRRIKWVKEFYQRIQTRGYSVHNGIRRKIRPEEIPPIPKKIRVVF